MRKFSLINASTVDEAISGLEEYGEKAKLIAGGTDLLGALKDQINPSYPEVLINIKSIPDLDNITQDGTTLRIGALALLEDIATSDVVNNKFPALAKSASSVGTPHLRNMGTIGGNLCQETRCWYYRSAHNRFFCFRKGGTLCNATIGDSRYNAILGGQVCFAVCPSDTAIALAALNATLITNKRSIPIEGFYVVLGITLDSDEMLIEVNVPEPASGTKQLFIKHSVRKAIDFAISSVATVITVEGNTVSDARIFLGGVAPTPYRATAAENAIKGNTINESTAEEASSAAVQDAFVLNNNAYVIPIAKSLVKEAILS